jgi:hypothetical protein
MSCIKGQLLAYIPTMLKIIEDDSSVWTIPCQVNAILIPSIITFLCSCVAQNHINEKLFFT